jgi:diadenosine tetraphosphate (Ap4A) HIT family hydrolase
MSVFNAIGPERIVGRTHHFFLVEDAYPVSPGHILVISKELRSDYFELSAEERSDLDAAIHLARYVIGKSHRPDGYNIGMNCGAAAGQTVFHFHCHVIPRYRGDMEDPRGGVRHCIIGKGYYNA